MIKFVIGLITAFTSFIGLLGITNSALATPIANQQLDTVVSPSVEQSVSLNVSSSLWQLSDGNAKDIFDHLSCSCAACSQKLETNDSLLIDN